MDKDGTPLLIKKEKVYRKSHHRTHHHHHHHRHQQHQRPKIRTGQSLSPDSSLVSSPSPSPREIVHTKENAEAPDASIQLLDESSVTVSSSSSSSSKSSSISSDNTGSSSDLSDSDKDSDDDAKKNPDPVFSEQRIPKPMQNSEIKGGCTGPWGVAPVVSL